MGAIDNLIHDSAFAIHHNAFVRQDIANVKPYIAVLMSKSMKLRI
jgi:hypothetical protein